FADHLRHGVAGGDNGARGSEIARDGLGEAPFHRRRRFGEALALPLERIGDFVDVEQHRHAARGESPGRVKRHDIDRVAEIVGAGERPKPHEPAETEILAAEIRGGEAHEVAHGVAGTARIACRIWLTCTASAKSHASSRRAPAIAARKDCAWMRYRSGAPSIEARNAPCVPRIASDWAKRGAAKSASITHFPS